MHAYAWHIIVILEFTARFASTKLDSRSGSVLLLKLLPHIQFRVETIKQSHYNAIDHYILPPPFYKPLKSCDCLKFYNSIQELYCIETRGAGLTRTRRGRQWPPMRPQTVSKMPSLAAETRDVKHDGGIVSIT